MIQMNLFTKQKEIHRLRNEFMVNVWGGGEGGIVRAFGINMYTLLCLKWLTNKVLLYSTWNLVQCYTAACTGGESGGEWLHVCVWLSPFPVHMRVSQHC